MPASYIIKPLWDIDWDIADFGFSSAEWHFTATRCLTTPLVVTSLNGHWIGPSALKATVNRLWLCLVAYI